jgi:TP901 family phage tail tape measure protein
MAKQVTSQDIYQDNIFNKLKTETQEQIDKFDALDKKLVEVSGTLKTTLTALKFDNSKDFQTLSNAMESSNKMTKESIALEKEMANLRKVNAQATLAETKAQEAQAKATARQRRETEKLNSAYKQESARLNELRNNYKNLAIQNQQNTKEGKALLKTITELDAKLKKIDASVGQNQRSVGNYQKAIGGLRNALLQLGVSFGVFQVLRGGISTISDFQSSLAELSAITGVSGDDLDKLGDKSIELSKKYGTSASNINEALKLAGSARPELLKNSEALAVFTEKALILSKASGDDVQTSISNLAGTLNAFEEPATKAGKTMDILANASQLGTQEIPYLTDAFTKFGGIAKANNVSIAESASLVEELGKKFPEASMAGTGLRNVMLKLSATKALPPEALSFFKQYGISLEDVEDKSKPFSERLKLLKPLLKDNAALVKIFGTENYLAAQTLIQGSERIGEFTEQLDKNGTAQDQANIKSKTLAEAGGRLKANFEALFLEFRNGSGALTTVVDFLARNLGTVVSVLTKLGALYLVFIARQKILNSELAKGFKGVGSFKDGLKGMVTNLKEGASAGTGLGGALKGIGWTALIGLAVEFATELYNIASGAKLAEYQLLQFQKAQQFGTEKGIELSGKYQKALKKELQAIDLMNVSDAKKNELRQKAIKGTKDEIKAKIENLKQSYKDAEQKRKEAYKEQKRLEKNQFLKMSVSPQEFTKQLIEAQRKVTNLESTKRALSATIQELYGEMGGLGDQIHGLVVEEKDLNNASFEINKEIKNQAKEVKALSTEFDKLDQYTSDYLQTLEEIKAIQIDTELFLIDEKIKALNESLSEQAKLGNEVDFTEVWDLIDEKYQLQIQAVKNSSDFEISEMYRVFYESVKIKKAELEAERNKLLSDVDLSKNSEEEKAKARETIQNNYKKKYDELIINLETEESDLNAKRVKLDEDASNKIIKLRRDFAGEIEGINNNIDNSQTEKELKDKEDALKKKQELAQMERDLAKMLADYLIEQSNRTIEQLDKQISNAEKNADYLQTLAENGNIKAEQSYAKEQEVIREANLQKQKELQRQQRIKLAETVFSTYSNKLNNPETSKNAVGETIKDVGILQAFINSLPKFFHGTEDTGSKGFLSDQFGAITGVTHSNERVINAKDNSHLKGISNERLVDIVKLHNEMGSDGFKKMDGFDIAGKSMDLEPMLNRLESIEKAIQNQPTTDYNFDKIVRGVAILMKEEKRGNTRIITKNRFS